MGLLVQMKSPGVLTWSLAPKVCTETSRHLQVFPSKPPVFPSGSSGVFLYLPPVSTRNTGRGPLTTGCLLAKASKFYLHRLRSSVGLKGGRRGVAQVSPSYWRLQRGPFGEP